MANETPSRPPPFMANAILNFHFDYVTPSLSVVPWFYQQGFPSHSFQGNSKQLLSMNKCRNVNTIKSFSHSYFYTFIHIYIYIFPQELFDEEQRKFYNLDQARSTI